MGGQGFSKLTADTAFSKMEKACASGCSCSALCQLFMAKEFLGLAAQTGERFSARIPEDILDLFRSVPIVPERYAPDELMEAFNVVNTICDNCQIETHSSLCTVNVVSTALGILIYGKDFVTEKDREAGVS